MLPRLPGLLGGARVQPGLLVGHSSPQELHWGGGLHLTPAGLERHGFGLCGSTYRSFSVNLLDV